MTETKQQWDKLCAALLSYLTTAVELIPTWLNMLKSTRTLTIIGTLALMYMTWKYGGLSDNQMLVINGVEGLLGISFMGFKTLRPSVITPAATTIEIQKSAATVGAQQAVPESVQLAPTYVPFDEAAWDKQLNAKAQELFLEVTPTSIYRAVWGVAQKLRAYYVNHIISFAYYYQAKAEAMFKAHFGFAYADRNKAESLATLKDQCGKIPVTFEQYLAQDPMNSSVIVDELVGIIKNNEWVAKLSEKRQAIEYKLQTAPVNGYNFNDAYWNAKELYQNS